MSLRENPGLDRGLSLTHRQHIFNASLVLVLPEFENKTGFAKHVLGGLGDRDDRPGLPRALR